MNDRDGWIMDEKEFLALTRSRRDEPFFLKRLDMGCKVPAPREIEIVGDLLKRRIADHEAAAAGLEIDENTQFDGTEVFHRLAHQNGHRHEALLGLVEDDFFRLREMPVAKLKVSLF